MRKLSVCLVAFIFLLTSCSSNAVSNTDKAVDNNSKEVTNEENQDANNKPDEDNKYNEASNDKSNENTQKNEESNSVVIENISEKVKDYIINGQSDKSEAQKLKWSKAFLDEVNIDEMYNNYINSGGNGEDIEAFALYITENAPVPNNWEELFKKDLLDIYGEEVVRLEYLEGDLYQAYVIIDGSEVPYVVVSSRTGYFHG